MFIESVSYKDRELYSEMLTSMASLSKLSSTSNIPYLGYREVENIFCLIFGAENLSRSDCSADAKKNDLGIGIKTFLNNNGRTLQKVAEFNKDSELYRGRTPKEVVIKVSELRNERIRATKRIHNLSSLIYHCVVRDIGRIMVYECPMDEVDIDNIVNINHSNKNTITFEDGKNEYSFNISKSTLYKRFYTKNVAVNADVVILDNPYEMIRGMVLMERREAAYVTKEKVESPHIYLPLFSDKGERHVPSKSGLNQWNALGRRRDPNEVYIPIPAWIHKSFPDFFPDRDCPFNLKLPNGRILNSKVCQEGRKALMSNPNLELGKWLLREVMQLKEGELLTYEMLERLGLDSVVVYKEKDNTYTIDFTEIGSYDIFMENYK